MTRGPESIPNTLWSLWLDGEEDAPAISRLAFSCWRALNPAHSVNVLTRADIQELISDYKFDVSMLPAAALSDIVRIELLARYGGVWVDASVVPSAPLASWLASQLNGGFFAFEKPGPDRPIASWFLAAQPSHPLVVKWRSAVQRYWSRPRKLIVDPRYGNASVPNPSEMVSDKNSAELSVYPYFWFHYLFGYLLDSDEEFTDIWQQCCKLPAEPSHELQGLIRSSTADEKIAFVFDVYANKAAVHKLDWRLTLTAELEQLIRQHASVTCRSEHELE